MTEEKTEDSATIEPIEITPEMIEAGRQAIFDFCPDGRIFEGDAAELAEKIFLAMLFAR